jgi:hypothetical protein
MSQVQKSEVFDGETFFIKAGYFHRLDVAGFDDRPFADTAIVHQPDAYALAAHLAGRFGADTIIDVGCGSARKLMALDGVQKIGIDVGDNISFCRSRYPNETWIEINLETIAPPIGLTAERLSRSIIICADVFEHLKDPRCLLNVLQTWSSVCPAIIITTPERDLVRGVNDIGPPANPCHAREWNLDEFGRLLGASGLEPAFLGLTVNNNQNLEKKKIIAVIDRYELCRVSRPPAEFEPVALMSTYNDVDIAPQTVAKCLDDGIFVHILDNWSTDGTFERLQTLASCNSNLVVERFPDERPQYYEWFHILKQKERLADKYGGRWIIHHDSDEVRCSPWRGVSLREGIWIADLMGFNAIDFTVLDFRPVDGAFGPGDDPEQYFRHFEFGKRSGQFVQTKCWKHSGEAVDLASSGGHDVAFESRRTLPYKFLLKHYPLRSGESARRKVHERLSRFSPVERARGWHIQYDKLTVDETFLWERSQLFEFDETMARQEFLTEFVSGVGILR